MVCTKGTYYGDTRRDIYRRTLGTRWSTKNHSTLLATIPPLPDCAQKQPSVHDTTLCFVCQAACRLHVGVSSRYSIRDCLSPMGGGYEIQLQGTGIYLLGCTFRQAPCSSAAVASQLCTWYNFLQQQQQQPLSCVADRSLMGRVRRVLSRSGRLDFSMVLDQLLWEIISELSELSF